MKLWYIEKLPRITKKEVDDSIVLDSFKIVACTDKLLNISKKTIWVRSSEGPDFSRLYISKAHK